VSGAEGEGIIAKTKTKTEKSVPQKEKIFLWDLFCGTIQQKKIYYEVWNGKRQQKRRHNDERNKTGNAGIPFSATPAGEETGTVESGF
jgi:hypothetical protein